MRDTLKIPTPRRSSGLVSPPYQSQGPNLGRSPKSNNSQDSDLSRGGQLSLDEIECNLKSDDDEKDRRCPT